MSVFVWEPVDLKTKSIESSDKIILVSQKIQLPNGVGIRSVSSSHTDTLVCCQDGSVQYCTHGSEHAATESILRKLEHVRSSDCQSVIQVAAGVSHNVVLTEDHRVYTWGQLGRTASKKGREKPKLVKSLASHCVLQISCGSVHTLALSDDGLVFAWGSNIFGQLGLGESMLQQKDPVIIPSLKGIPVMLLAAGGDHSFILSKSGSVYGWGRNDYGQLGLNNTKNSDVPKKCQHFNNKNVKYICCGEYHTACLTKDGSVFTFGAGSHGQLGHCSSSNQTTPKQVMQLAGCEVSQTACGSNHTLAYVPQSGGLHIFGFGGSGCFSVMEEEYENCHISLSGYFVQLSDNQSPTLCLPVDKQNHHHRIKTIHAGGNHSFITVVGAKETCDADDFRNEDPSKQILTLTQEKISMLDSLNPDATQSNEIQKIFSSASCLNGSFLLPNDEHCGNSSKNHGVDMNAVQNFFKKFAKNPKIMKMIYDKIENNLIPQLPPSSLDGEAIRLYSVLPACDLFDKPEFHSSLICQFAKSFLDPDLDGKARKIFTSWCSHNQPSFFTNFVVIFKQCAQYLLQLPCSANSKADVKRNKDLLTCLNMLKVLHQANEIKHIIPARIFILPELKDMDVQKEYIRLHLSQLQKQQAERFIQLVIYLLPLLNLHIVGEERERNEVFLKYFSMFPMLSQGLNFCNYPFLFDVEKKSILFQTEAKLQMLTAQVSELETRNIFELLLTNGCYYHHLLVDRQNIVNDTFSNLSSTNTASFKKPLRVQFQRETSGIGVMKEFFRLFFQEVMGSTFGFFTADDESKLMWFNTELQKDVEQSRQIEQFRLIGILCGLVIYNSVPIDLHFPLAMYKKLLKKPVNLDDVKELMPILGSKFQDALNYDGDEFEDLYCLTFQFPQSAGNELCPGGADRFVTQQDKKVYFNLVVDHLLNKTVKAQFDAFSKGFHSACGGKILNIFQPEELRSLLEGNEDYDFTVLEKNTTYIDYHRDDPTIILFWEVFHEMSLADKKTFLLFLTGSDRIPINGMKDLKIQIQPHKDGMLPRAYTCTKRLCLPHYKTKEQLQNNLLAAIPQTEGFSIFDTADDDDD